MHAMHATKLGPHTRPLAPPTPSLQNGLGSRTAVEPVGCMVACDAAPGCDSFAYNPAQQRCFLKTGASRRTCGAAETVRAADSICMAAGMWLAKWAVCGGPNADLFCRSACLSSEDWASWAHLLPFCLTKPFPPPRRRCRRCASARAARPTRAAPGRRTSEKQPPMRPCRWLTAAPRRPQCSWWRPLPSRSLGRLPPMRKAGVPPEAPAADSFMRSRFVLLSLHAFTASLYILE